MSKRYVSSRIGFCYDCSWADESLKAHKRAYAHSKKFNHYVTVECAYVLKYGKEARK